jgi:hypothetical protein
MFNLHLKIKFGETGFGKREFGETGFGKTGGHHRRRSYRELG